MINTALSKIAVNKSDNVLINSAFQRKYKENTKGTYLGKIVKCGK
jgi:hypothetical protein